MGPSLAVKPIDLLPSRPQTFWGWPAVLNFFLGGLGAGFYVVTVLAEGPDGRSAVMTLAAWLAPACVLVGFAAVAAEAGRPLRGPRVLLRVGTSWMSRELWLGGAFVALVLADGLRPLGPLRAGAAVAALVLAIAQGFIVRGARGIPAWNVPVMPTLFGLSALVSGGGLYLVVAVSVRRVPSVPALAAVLMLLIGGVWMWVRYLTWSSEAAFAEAVAPLTRGREARLVVGAGLMAPLLLTAGAAAWPAVAAPALALAGILMVLGQLHAKARLVLTAGRLRPVTLAGLRIKGRTR
jgi:formate-dependent nitrite reductase membrane component NrfD